VTFAPKVTVAPAFSAAAKRMRASSARAAEAELGSGLEHVDLDAGLGQLDRGGEGSHSTAGDGDLLYCGHVRTSLFLCCLGCRI
jgi:hypothetical protein